MRSGYLGGILGCFGALRGPLKLRMGDVPPKKGDGVGKIRGTSQVTVFRLLFTSVAMKMAAKQDLGVWYFWLL